MFQFPRKSIALFYLFSLILFCFIPFNSPVHAALLTNPIDPLDIITKVQETSDFTKIVEYLKKVLGNDGFYAHNSEQIKEYLLKDDAFDGFLDQVEDSKDIWEKGRSVLESIVSDQKIGDQLITNKRYLRSVAQGDENQISFELMESMAANSIYLKIIVGILYFGILNVHSKTIQNLTDRRMPFIQKLIFHLIFFAIEYGIGYSIAMIIVFLDGTYYDELYSFPINATIPAMLLLMYDSFSSAMSALNRAEHRILQNHEALRRRRVRMRTRSNSMEISQFEP